MTSDQSAPASGAPAVLPSLSWAGEFRAQFALGWPLIVAQLAQISLLTTDVVMLSRLGPKYLAAATIANALLIALQLFGLGSALPCVFDLPRHDRYLWTGGRWVTAAPRLGVCRHQATRPSQTPLPLGQ
jgi:hypothetical protein